MSDDLVRTKDLLLRRLKFGAYMQASMEFETRPEEMFDRLAYKLRAEVLAEHVLDTETVVPFSGQATVRLPRLRGALRVLRGKPVSAPVAGRVTVPATYWRLFPQADMVYPDSLGSVVRYVQLAAPYWEQDV